MSRPKITKKQAGLAGVVFAAAVGAGYAAAPDVPDPPPVVAPIEVGEGTLGAAGAVYIPVVEPKLPPKESDFDGDGVQDTLDHCPWNAGSPDAGNGCP